MARTPQESYLDSVISELLSGLITDGAHHKQYHLEQALHLLCEDEWIAKAKAEFQWEEGIPA